MHNRKCSQEIQSNNFSDNNIFHRHIVLPKNSATIIMKNTKKNIGKTKQSLTLQNDSECN